MFCNYDIFKMIELLKKAEETSRRKAVEGVEKRIQILETATRTAPRRTRVYDVFEDITDKKLKMVGYRTPPKQVDNIPREDVN